MIASYDLAVHGDLVLPGGQILANGWLGVQDGTITAIGTDALRAATTMDVRGRLVFPGFVDAHVHCRSNELEGIAAATRSAAAGGTTTIIDMPFDRPSRPVRTVAALQKKIEDVGIEAVVDVALWATFPPRGALTEIEGLAVAGACGFKASTIHVDDDRFPRVPDGQLLEAFQLIAGTDLPVAAHQENQDIVDHVTRRVRAAGMPEPMDHPRSRPPVAETEATARLLELAHASGARLHVVHGTVPRTFDLIAWNRSQGVRATGETCVQYLLLTEAVFETLGTRAKCNPPLRSAEARDALWKQLAAGTIDIVTSDHSPYPLERKDTSDVFDAWAGLSGAETFGTLMYSEGVATGRLSLGRFLEIVAAGPAEIYGLGRKGRLSVGCDADLAIIDPSVHHTIDETRLQCASGWSAYEGWPVTGRVTDTFVRGRRVFSDGTVTGSPGDGRFVRPDVVP